MRLSHGGSMPLAKIYPPLCSGSGVHCDNSFSDTPENTFRMTGFLGFAPIYVNGLLAIFFVFVLPGLVLVRAFDIADFPQRWLIVLLSSLAANHLLVTLIAVFHLDPLWACRAVAAVLVLALVAAAARGRTGARSPASGGKSIVLLSDIGWLLLSLVVLGIAYINIWKHGVPAVFDDTDLSASWNKWSLIWSQGQFPTFSLGYPQFIPSIWAVTYIFTGSLEQYFSFYIYLILLILPPALNAVNLGRISWWHPLLPGLVFLWFMAEAQGQWLRYTLQEGFPDWVAAVFGFSGAVLFVANNPRGELDRDKTAAALISLCLVSIAAATKPMYGLFTIAILIAICSDAARHLPSRERNRLVIAAIGLVGIFVCAYVLNYLHLAARSMPNFPVLTMSERFARAATLFNEAFTLPFKLLVLAGLVMSPFLKRIRWLALPLTIGFLVWANTAAYDLRNILGLLLISAIIPLYAAANAWLDAGPASSQRHWSVPDSAVAAGWLIVSVGLTLPLALNDGALKERFARDQFGKGPGVEINRSVEQLLGRGCTIFTATSFVLTIAKFQPFLDKMQFFVFNEPMNATVLDRLSKTEGCTAILFPNPSHPEILRVIAAAAELRGLRKVTEGNNFVLLVSSR